MFKRDIFRGYFLQDFPNAQTLLICYVLFCFPSMTNSMERQSFETVIVAQLVNKLPSIYVTRRFSTMFTRSRSSLRHCGSFRNILALLQLTEDAPRVPLTNQGN